ncbi:MAG: hypothetical protein OEZ06_31475 [Myxococcales bacterium]|nr:hypothetical protein [Myxococcales bacterium]
MVLLPGITHALNRVVQPGPFAIEPAEIRRQVDASVMAEFSGFRSRLA